MRVISGIARGTKLNSIESMSTRPTLDRVKESLFNIIQNESHSKKYSTIQTIAIKIKPTINANNLQPKVFVVTSWNSSNITSMKLIPMKLPQTKLKNISSQI